MKQKREEERKENKLIFNMLRKSMSNSPTSLRKKKAESKKTKEVIRIESVDEYEGRLH